MRFIRMVSVVVVGLLCAVVQVGCASTTSKTVIEQTRTVTTRTVHAPRSSKASAIAASQSASAPSAASSAGAQPRVFHGSGQQVLGTIDVPADTTISWSCPSCSNTNFIINNANSDASSIPTNGLDQTQGVDTLAAGVYHTVVVDTGGGPWTVAIGGTAPTPTGTAPAQASAASAAPSQPSTQCDPNIAVSGAADCAFAENTFYEYWSNQGSGSFQAYSSQDGQLHSVSCGSGSIISCTSDQGATVTFPQSAIGNYTQSQANHYAATHKVAP